jgi:hypothetical protein
MTRSFLILLVGLVVLAAPGLPADKDADEPMVTDADAKKAIERFEREFDTKDLDFQLEAVIRLGKIVHPTVGARLLHLLKDDETEIQVEAMKALGRQTGMAKSLERKMKYYLDEKKFEPRLVATAVRTVGKLELKRLEEELISMIDSNDDDVAISALRVLGAWKSYKLLKPVLLLWEFYPDEGRWTTGTVRVDTGADTATEQRLAKAKWNAKYGGRAKRARPEVVKAIRENVNAIIGLEKEKEQLKLPAELREWISENKVLLRKHR